MERESFENEAVAAVMNDNFIGIKVDREERPGVDKTDQPFPGTVHRTIITGFCACIYLCVAALTTRLMNSPIFGESIHLTTTTRSFSLSITI